MKNIYLALLLFVSAIGAYAQTPVSSSEMSNVIVIKKEWRFQVRSPMMDESPFLAMEERVQEEQDLRNTAAENRRRASLGIRPVKPPVRARAERQDGTASFAYVYQVKIKNVGVKAISALTLEYVFFEPGTKREVGRKKFLSKESIAPGKTRNLVFRSAAPPAGTVNAKDADKKSSDIYLEEVIIQSVEYADGSAWQPKLKNP